MSGFLPARHQGLPQALMAGWLATPSPGAGGSLQAWLIGQNLEEPPAGPQ
jgi:hypothetical protein